VGEDSKAETFEYLQFFQFGRKQKLRRKSDNNIGLGSTAREIWIIESYVQTSEGVHRGGVDPSHWI
jgi:hypothetical protein